MSLFSETDIAPFRADRLILAQQEFFPDVTLDDAYLLEQLQAAEDEVGRLLSVFLEPTTVFPSEPTQAQIDALNGKPYYVETGYDYDTAFFQDDRWGYIVLRQRPVISVASINLVYPNPLSTMYQIPQDWIRLDKKYGHIRLVPASATFVAPLGAWLMQVVGGGSAIPSLIQVQYVAGLDDAKNKWKSVIAAIYRKAVLNIIEQGYFPSNSSISADGLSQSRALFDVEKAREALDATLFGPKGSNGGLKTAIHGVIGTMGGVVA